MKSISTRFNLMVGPAALVLLTLCLLPAPARACDHRDGPNVSSCYGLGLAPGQSLRVNLANLIELAGREQNPVEVFARVRLYDAQGRVIAQSAEVTIPLNQFRFFNFNRAALPFPGEPGTGRLQMLVEVEVRSIPNLIVEPRNRDTVSASLEIIDNSTGGTTVSFGGAGPVTGRVTGIAVDPSDPSDFGTDSLIGIVPGQMLRFSVLNPPTSISGAQREPLRGHVKVFDSGGALIAQSAEVVVPPGEFRSIDINRDDLHLAGEPGTGRLQTLGRYRISADWPASFPASLELVDSNGRTAMWVLLPAVQKGTRGGQ